MKALKPGRIVEYVLLNGSIRPLMIVRVWNQDSGVVNGVLFRDGSNDNDQLSPTGATTEWVTSAKYDGSPTPGRGTWHWPVREEEPRAISA